MITTIIIFLAASALPLFLKSEKHIRIVSVWSALIGTAATLNAALPVLFSQTEAWSNSWWMIDKFSALMMVLVSFVYMAAVLVSYRYIGHEYHEGAVNFNQVKMYFSLISLFALTMIVTVGANNTMLVWLALESTTLSSTFLVGLYKKKTSVEAAWKYIILCSTGITLGLIGVLLINYGAHLSGGGHDIFLLTYMADNAKALPAGLVKWAFIFLFVGFGTKVGFVPMHAWLPDAHSKAPSPISAMFSGILLNVALYVILRFKHIADGTIGGPDWTNRLFLVFGILSILLPALALLIQNNYKRMLAYSSIEHMGLIALAVSFPPVGLAAAFMHMIGHTITKSMLFFGAGEFLLKWKTTKIDKISGLMKSSPYSGTLFLLGVLAIVATPPSAVFASEYFMFTSMFAHGWILPVIILFLLSLIAFAMLRLTIVLLYRGGENEAGEMEKWNITHTVMTVQFILIIGLAFIFTSPGGLAFINSLVKTIN